MGDHKNMDESKYFNRNYFLSQLQSAGAIVTEDENDLDSLTLKKVPNITIGLVLAAKSLHLFENNIILTWIRKGRKLTSLIEDQFDLYDKLSSYLLSNVSKEEDIEEWKELLNNTKYVYPANEKEGWAQIFGETPDILENVDIEKLDQEVEKTDKDGKINQENKAEQIIEKEETKILEKMNCSSEVNEDKVNQTPSEDSDSWDEVTKIAEKVNCSSEVNEDKVNQTPSEGSDLSEGEDDLDDLFNEVEAELNAAEENDEQSENISTNVKETKLNAAEQNDEQSENISTNVIETKLNAAEQNYEEAENLSPNLLESKYDDAVEKDKKTIDISSNVLETKLNAVGKNKELSENISSKAKETKLNAAGENGEQLENISSKEKHELDNSSRTGVDSEKKEVIQDIQKAAEPEIPKKETKQTDINSNNNDLTLPASGLKSNVNTKTQEHKKDKKEEKVEIDESVLEMEAPEDELFDFLDTTLETSISETQRKPSDDTSDTNNDLNLSAKKSDIESNNEIEAHKKDESDQKMELDESNLDGEATEEAELFDFLEAELAAAESKSNNSDSISSRKTEESRDNSTKRTGNHFDNVVIFADEVYKPFLHHMEFNNDFQKVFVASDGELTPKNLKKLVPECSGLISGNKKLLCVLVTGLYNFAPLRSPKVSPLPKLPAIGNLFFEFDYRKTIFYRKKYQTMIRELLLKGWKCQRYVKEHLDTDATVVLVPPLPGFLTQYGNQFSTEEKFLVETYKEFCTQWSNTCCDMFSIQGLDIKIIKYYMLGCNEFLTMMHPSASIEDIQVRLNEWYEMMKLLLQSNYKEKVSNNFCAPFNHDMKCRNVTKLSKCPHPHRCEICGQGGHGKKKCHVLDHTICLKYNWTFCNTSKCKYRHVCYACENAHLVINCSKNFIQHNNIQYMIQNLYRKVRYKRVILVGNQTALAPFILSRIPELKIIANIRQLEIDINLDSHESTMQALYTMQVYMVNHPEFTSDTLWILTADLTNWLESDSLCRNHFMNQLPSCTEEIKMFYLKYDLATQFYKAEEFVKSTKPYLGANSDFILAPLIGQTVLCPPAICPSDIPNICPPGLEKIDLNEFHKAVHDSPELQKLQVYSPGLIKSVLSHTLEKIDQGWMESVEKIMKWQNVSVFALDKYLKNKEETFNVMEDINLRPTSKGYEYWDAFMVLLIKYLCDPMSEQMELICDYSKKIYNIKENNDSEFEEKKDVLEDKSTIVKVKMEENVPATNKPLDVVASKPSEWIPASEEFDTKIKSEPKVDSIMDKINRKIRSEKIAEHIENFTQSYGVKEEKPKVQEIKSEHNDRSSNSLNSVSKHLEKAGLPGKSSPAISQHPKSSNILREVIREDAKKKIFVHNLPKELKSDDVHEMLKACGETQEFEREVIDEKTKKAYCSVKFKSLTSVYRVDRLLNGKNICGQILTISQFGVSGQNISKDKEKNFDEVADKKALDRINEVISKIEKKKKLLRGYLKSATKEKESKMQTKKEVGKETIKEDSTTKEKKKEEKSEKKLKEAFRYKDSSSPLFPCVNTDEDSDSKKEENKSSRSHNDKRHRSRSKERGNSSQNKKDADRRKRSRSRDRNDRGTSSSNKERNKSSRTSSPSRRSKSPSSRPRRTRSRSRDRTRRSRSNEQGNRNIDRLRRSGSRDTNKSRDIDRNKRSKSRDNDRRLRRSGSRDIDRTKRSKSRDNDRNRRSRSRDITNYRPDNQGLSEAERRSLAGEFSRIDEGREPSKGVFYRDKEKVPKIDSRNLEKNRSHSRERNLSRWSDNNPMSREHEDLRRQLTPIQEDRSRSPRRYANNRSRSHSRSRSPSYRRSFPPDRVGSPPPTGQLPLPAPPPAPRRGQYNQGSGLVTYPGMFGSGNSSASTVSQQSQPGLISYQHLSQDGQKSKESNSTSDTSSKISILKISNMLFSMCDQLDILGQSLKIVLEKVFQVKHDEYQMLKVFAIDDHLLLMNMVLKRFSKLLEVAPDAQTKNTIENLVHYTKYLVKMAENPSSFSASLSSASNVSVPKIDITPPPVSDKALMFGIDIEQVARITLNKDTSYIIEYLKNALENIGTTPSKDMVSKLALEISIQHFKMASLSGKESIAVDYRHGSSTSVVRKPQPVSIDYGHGSSGVTKSSPSSFGADRDWGRNDDINRSGSQPLYASRDVGQPSMHDPRYCEETSWSYAQQRGMSSDQQAAAGHMYPSSANDYPGNPWAGHHGSGNMGVNYGRDSNQGSAMMPHNQWGPQGQGGAGAQGGWPQSYAPPGSMAQTWPQQGQSSVMPQGSSTHQQHHQYY